MFSELSKGTGILKEKNNCDCLKLQIILELLRFQTELLKFLNEK